MPVADPDALTTRLCFHACYPEILLMLDQGTTAWAIGGVYVMYMASASDQGCEYGSQLYASFGLDDHYLIFIVTKCYRDI